MVLPPRLLARVHPDHPPFADARSQRSWIARERVEGGDAVADDARREHYIEGDVGRREGRTERGEVRDEEEERSDWEEGEEGSGEQNVAGWDLVGTIDDMHDLKRVVSEGI